MLQRWKEGPAWVVGLGMGALFAVGMGLYFVAQGGPLPAALTAAGVAGVLFGAVMGPCVVRSRRLAQAAVDGGDEAMRSANRGLRWRATPPVSEQERLARVQLARHRLQVLEGQRVWGTALFVVLCAGAAWFAVSRSPWWWLEVGFFAVVIVVTWLQRRRLRRIVAAGTGDARSETAD